MKYCLLTELDILTPSIREQINAVLTTESHLLTLTAEYNDTSTSDLNHKYRFNTDDPAEHALYASYKEKIIAYFKDHQAMDFKIHQLHKDLEDEIFNQLPAKIKNMPMPPYIRLQTMTNGDYLFPHTDSAPMPTTLITSVGPNIESTWFWRQTEPHHIAIKTLPDMDKVERVSCAKLSDGETWLFNINEIHSVERPLGNRDSNRVCINFRWSNTTVKEVMQALL